MIRKRLQQVDPIVALTIFLVAAAAVALYVTVFAATAGV